MAGAKENGSRARLALAPLAFAALVACGSGAPETVAVDESSVHWNASDYCRETTCPPDTEETKWPQGSQCAPSGWAATCAANGTWDVPLWWRTACVGWSLQKDASARVSFAEAEVAAKGAFDAWTGTSCAGGHPSVAVTELDPVECGAHYAKQGGANQNVIVFHDGAWPHEHGDQTIALTTTTFVPRTGEILDADIEINEATFAVGVHGETYDLRAVLTHEIGHLFGLAHSSTRASVMYATDEGRDSAKTRITAGDSAGVCAIYPSDGVRNVSPLVQAGGRVPEGVCDPTPHHGFSTACED